MVAVLVDDVRRTFGSVTALAGVSWQARAGQITAVLGPNGAGKTTTMECLEGLQPTSMPSCRDWGSTSSPAPGCDGCPEANGSGWPLQPHSSAFPRWPSSTNPPQA